MVAKLKIAFDFYNIFGCLMVLFDYFKNLNLEFELIIQILTFFQYFQRIFFLFAIAWLMINNFKYFTKSPWSKYFNNFKPICNMITNDGFVVIFLISKILIFLILSKIGFMTNIIDFFIIFNLLFLVVSQIHMIKMISDNRLIIQLFDT